MFLIVLCHIYPCAKEMSSLVIFIASQIKDHLDGVILCWRLFSLESPEQAAIILSHSLHAQCLLDSS